MKTISVREMKARWAAVEKQVRAGETFVVLNRGRPAARIVPAEPHKVAVWDDHIATAAKGQGRSSMETVRADRDGRW